jgi:hypothetical protein
MRHVRVVALCFVAVCALCAAAATSASAAEGPALYECAKLKKSKATKKYEGKYEKGCVTKNAKGEGEYELQEGIGKLKSGVAKTFKGKGGAANLGIAGLAEVKCSKSSDEGHFTSAYPIRAADIVATFAGCYFESKECTNTVKAGATKPGEIKTAKLKAEAGYLKGGETSKPVIGVRVSAESESSPLDAEFVCGELYFGVGGSDIGEVAEVDLNKFTKEVTLTFAASAGGEPHWKTFEGASEKDWLLTQDSSKEGVFSGTEGGESGESTVVTGKGETLEVKAGV